MHLPAPHDKAATFSVGVIEVEQPNNSTSTNVSEAGCEPCLVEPVLFCDFVAFLAWGTFQLACCAPSFSTSQHSKRHIFSSGFFASGQVQAAKLSEKLSAEVQRCRFFCHFGFHLWLVLNSESWLACAPCLPKFWKTGTLCRVFCFWTRGKIISYRETPQGPPETT